MRLVALDFEYFFSLSWFCILLGSYQDCPCQLCLAHRSAILFGFFFVTEKIPSSPWSLRHSPADEGAPLTEFQEELVQLASQLNGDHRHVKYPHLGKSMNVGQANAYVTDAVSRFLEAGRMAVRSGQDPESMVDLKPSWVGRRAGIFNYKSYDSS
jgi:hypothetical protein